jgi:hydrogenase large subunit
LAYSWLKAPRYKNLPCEAGPLARMWVNGDYRQGISVMDRPMARALEAQKVANAMLGWLDQITEGASEYTPVTTPFSKSGEGLTEAPRGALGHWLTTAASTALAPNGQTAISSYQVITPTCWNASPKDTSGVRGPLEQALVGTPVSVAAQPVEVLRVVHSFDPCMSCAVHVMRPDGKPVTILNAQAEF